MRLIEGKFLEDSYSKLITNFLNSKVFYHLGELKPALKNLDASLQACHSLSTEGQNKEKRRKLDSGGPNEKVEEGGALTVCSDPQLVLMLRSRLYYEKGSPFK